MAKIEPLHLPALKTQSSTLKTMQSTDELLEELGLMNTIRTDDSINANDENKNKK